MTCIRSHKKLLEVLRDGDALCREVSEGGQPDWYTANGHTVAANIATSAVEFGRLEASGDGLFGKETSQTFRLRSDA